MCSVEALVRALVDVSEKAANVARLCRQNGDIFQLLVAEKSPDEANPRFVQDFKTLADVLIQEMVRHDIGKAFPDMRENIRGEESSTFTNSLGETITVQVGDSLEETANLLEKVLNGNKLVADLLAAEVHRSVVTDEAQSIEGVEGEISPADVGIWVDPIDGTAEYVQGKARETAVPGIWASGLRCVTVLLGVFEIESGRPIVGVINQPFLTELEDGAFSGKIFWGVAMDGVKRTNIPPREDVAGGRKKVAILSSAENKKYIYYLRDTLGYSIVFSAGAGHKILKLIQGDADLYLVSTGSTYKWDTCAPQAILRALGGGLINLQETIDTKTVVELSYAKSSGKCNIGGVLGFRTHTQLMEFSKLL
ncbi:inositol polyphosphate 1-phosphatase [Phlebotomus argentipes]|uniref:inositol polyphosphate 1-phosphatase n=1 Tax=Phlebotomus argentipes TaxID=94469 RepID=UPI0028936C82|nr:inositol polyphosphate 1-phosphatase [Phlebotomus argentipes]